MKHFQSSEPINPRCGSLLTEGVVACLILGVAIGMLVPGLSAIGRQRKAIRFETLAMIELNNMADAIRKPSASVEIAISPWFSERYSDAEFATERLTNMDDAAADLLEGLTLTIRRPLTEGMPDQTVSVVVWRSKGESTP